LTNDWIEGILVKMIKQAGKTIIHLDGPMDTLWIENLNSCFDDNKNLCISNG
jgi:dynein heavy chain